MRAGERVVVVGAGVAGLTTAFVLAETGASVHVIAEQVPGVTSLAAGAMWGPYLVGLWSSTPEPCSSLAGNARRPTSRSSGRCRPGTSRPTGTPTALRPGAQLAALAWARRSRPRCEAGTRWPSRRPSPSRVHRLWTVLRTQESTGTPTSGRRPATLLWLKAGASAGSGRHRSAASLLPYLSIRKRPAKDAPRTMVPAKAVPPRLMAAGTVSPSQRARAIAAPPTPIARRVIMSKATRSSSACVRCTGSLRVRFVKGGWGRRVYTIQLRGDWR
ncbi:MULTISPECIES: FAD-dependent oxidoreductase [Streptomyces]|uniref:FAD-dependent oxidoreductase n=1 Tax=Streptomyces TaxID=1883 RepID=UPI002B1BD916|nr:MULTISPECIES: FAD-dependent oxidoreductase [Streptomyces]